MHILGNKVEFLSSFSFTAGINKTFSCIVIGLSFTTDPISNSQKIEFYIQQCITKWNLTDVIQHIQFPKNSDINY